MPFFRRIEDQLEVEAVHVTVKTDIDDLSDIIEDHTQRDDIAFVSNGVDCDFIDADFHIDGEELHVDVGDWIILNSDDTVSACSASDFAKSHLPITS